MLHYNYSMKTICCVIAFTTSFTIWRLFLGYGLSALCTDFILNLHIFDTRCHILRYKSAKNIHKQINDHHKEKIILRLSMLFVFSD